MIDIQYTEENIKITTSDLSYIFEQSQLPIKIEFVKQITSQKIWETYIDSFSWATFPNTEIIDVIIKDNQNNHIYTHKWNVIENGNYFYQKLWLYCKKRIDEGKPNKGVIIGTHNGDFGEWVPVALDKISELILVEASQRQFNELKHNYNDFNQITFINNLVTENGEPTIFYEGGQGYTNSVLKRVIDYWEKEEITSTLKESIKFSTLITSDVNWLHLDVEGLDDKLLYSLTDEQYLNLDLIMFEYNNLSPEERENIDNFIKLKNFTTFKEKGICLAVKNI
jgi:hypothetical protein